MKTKRKNGFYKKALSLLLVLVIFAGSLPMTAFHTAAAGNVESILGDQGDNTWSEEAFQGRDEDVFSALGFDTSVLPEGYDPDTTDNPYGRDRFAGNQVFELLLASGSGSSIYGKNNNEVPVSSLTGGATGGARIPLDMYAAAKADFDGDGLPGEVVYVGFLYDEISYGSSGGRTPIYFTVQDAGNGKTGQIRELGKVNPAQSVSTGGTVHSEHDYAWQNLLQVTAGDYDGDGIAEIAVYVAQHQNVRVDIYKWLKTSASGEEDWLDMQNWGRVWTYVLSNDNKSTIPNMVSLVSSDLNRDGIDDLGISYGRFALDANNVAEITASRARILWGSRTKMLQSSSELNLYEDEHGGALTRVSLTTGDLDGDGYAELIATGHLTADLTEYFRSELWETNTSRSITTYIYDENLGLVKNYLGTHKVIDGEMVTSTVDGESSTAWKSANGFDGQNFSQPLMRTNAAVIKPEGFDYPILYLDSYLYECTEGQLMLKYSLDEDGGIYDGSNSLKVNSNVKGSYWGTPNQTANGVYAAHYVEFGADAADIHGKGYSILATSMFRRYSDYGKHYAVTGVLSGSSSGILEITMTANALSQSQTSQSTLEYDYPVFIDVDLDTIIIEYTGQHYLTYSDPKVLAIIAAAPYFSDVDEVYGYDYAWQNTTSWSQITGHGDGKHEGVDLEIGAWNDNNFVVTGGQIVLEEAIMFTLEYMKEKMTTKEYTLTFETSQNEDAIAFYSIPTENYVYRLYVPDGNGGYNVELDIISNTFQPVNQVLTLDYYESIRSSYDQLPKIAGTAITSTPGDPGSYPSSTGGYDVISQWNDDPAGAGFGNGAITQEIVVTKEESKSYNLGAALDFKFGGGTEMTSFLTQSKVDVAGGVQFSLNPSGGWTDVDISGTAISGTVANMPLQFQQYGYYYNWKIFSYKYVLDDGSHIPVVSYVVNDVAAPPILPDDFEQDFDRSTSDKNVLTWTYQDSFSAFYIYRYFDFPVGGGLQLIAEIPSHTTNYAVRYDENGRVYKEYYFEDKNLAPYTEYSYAIQVERLAKTPPLSSPSQLLSFRTKAANGNPVITMSESDDEQNGSLLVWPDKNAYITAIVSGPAGEAHEDYYTTVQYQWQKKTETEPYWQDMVGETSQTLAFIQAMVSDEAEYRVRVNTLSKIDNTAITSYSSIVSIEHSKRSSYFSEVSVRDLSGGGVEVYAQLRNAHGDSASIPGGKVSFFLENAATGVTYFVDGAPNAAGAVGIFVYDDLPEGMYHVTATYMGSTIFKQSSGEALYLSQRSSGLDIDVPASFEYGDGAELVFRSVNKAGGITSTVPVEPSSYMLMKADELSFGRMSGAISISNGATVTKGTAYTVTYNDIVYSFTATWDGMILIYEGFAIYDSQLELGSYVEYSGETGVYEIAKNLGAGGYMLQMTYNGTMVSVGFTVRPRKITVQLLTEKGSEGINATNHSIREFAVVSGSWAECDMENGALIPSIGNTGVALDYINSAGTVFTNETVDALCGYYVVVAQKSSNAKRFPNYEITYLDGSMTIIGATKKVTIGVRDFEGENVGAIYAVSPTYEMTRDTAVQAHSVGTRLIFTALPDEGYEVYDWYINGMPIGSKATTLSYILLAEDTTVEVQFVVKHNALIFDTAGDEGGGTITASDPTLESNSSILANSYFVFTARANKGYHFKEWRYTELGKGTVYDDSDFGKMESIFEFMMPTVNTSLYAVFERDFYTFTYTDLTNQDALVAWYEVSPNGDVTAPGERVYVESGERIKGGTVITVEPAPGYSTHPEYNYISIGSVGYADYSEKGYYRFTLDGDTRLTGYTVHEYYDITVSAEVELPYKGAINLPKLYYSVNGEAETEYQTKDPSSGENSTIVLKDIAGGSGFTLRYSHGPAFVFRGFYSDATQTVANTVRDPLAVRVATNDKVEAGIHYSYAAEADGVVTVYYFVAPAEGTLSYDGANVTVYVQDAIEIAALAEDHDIVASFVEVKYHLITLADITSYHNEYELVLPEDSRFLEDTQQVLIHDGQSLTVSLKPTAGYTVSYWEVLPEGESKPTRIRATALRFTFENVTQSFTLTPIYSSTTYQGISWDAISADKMAITVIPTADSISSVAAGGSFSFTLSGEGTKYLSQVFANGVPFVDAANDKVGTLTYTDQGGVRVYTISNIYQNIELSVSFKRLGVTVNHEDISALSGSGWTFDPGTAVLNITRSGVTISGASQANVPDLTISFNSTAYSATVRNLTLDPRDGESLARVAVTIEADTFMLTVEGTSFIEGQILAAGSVTMRGNGGALTVEQTGASIYASSLTLLGTVTLKLDTVKEEKAAEGLAHITLGEQGNTEHSPTLTTDATLEARLFRIYSGHLSVNLKSESGGARRKVALMAYSVYQYGGTIELNTDSNADNPVSRYVGTYNVLADWHVPSGYCYTIANATTAAQSNYAVLSAGTDMMGYLSVGQQYFKSEAYLANNFTITIEFDEDKHWILPITLKGFENYKNKSETYYHVAYRDYFDAETGYPVFRTAALKEGEYHNDASKPSTDLTFGEYFPGIGKETLIFAKQEGEKITLLSGISYFSRLYYDYGDWESAWFEYEDEDEHYSYDFKLSGLAQNYQLEIADSCEDHKVVFENFTITMASSSPTVTVSSKVTDLNVSGLFAVYNTTTGDAVKLKGNTVNFNGMTGYDSLWFAAESGGALSFPSGNATLNLWTVHQTKLYGGAEIIKLSGNGSRAINFLMNGDNYIYNTIWNIKKGNGAFDLKTLTLSEYNNTTTTLSGVKYAQISLIEGSGIAESVVIDVDNPEGSVESIIIPPTLGKTIHSLKYNSAGLWDAELCYPDGTPYEGILFFWVAPFAVNRNDGFVAYILDSSESPRDTYGYYMKIFNSFGVFSTMPSGEYVIRIKCEDDNPSDATYYYVDVPITITRSKTTGGDLSIDSSVSAAFRGSSVEFSAIPGDFMPSRYVWYLNGEEVKGYTDDSFTLEISDAFSIGDTVQIRVESYNGDIMIGFAEKSINVIAGVGDITVSAPNAIETEDGFVLHFDPNDGTEDSYTFTVTVSMEDSSVAPMILTQWSLWGNTRRGTVISNGRQATMTLTIDPKEIGVDGYMYLTVHCDFYTDEIGSIEKTITLYIVSEHVYDDACDTGCNLCTATREVEHSFTKQHKDATHHWLSCDVCNAADEKKEHIPDISAATETKSKVCTECGYVMEKAIGHVTHQSAARWQSDDTHHWHECTGCNGQELEKAAHSYGDWVVITVAGAAVPGSKERSCICGYKQTQQIPATGSQHTHRFDEAWHTDLDGHWNECACGQSANVADHSFTDATCDAPQTCSVCGFTVGEALAHTPNADDGDCTTEITCSLCDAVITEAADAHTGGTATCQTKAKCSTCNTEYGDLAPHSAEADWRTNETHHYHLCVYWTEGGTCQETFDYAEHADVNHDGKCDTCGDQMRTADPEAPVDPEPADPTDPDPSDGKDGLGAGAIVGITLGSAAVVGGGGFAIFWFAIKKKKWSDLVKIFKK